MAFCSISPTMTSGTAVWWEDPRPEITKCFSSPYWRLNTAVQRLIELYDVLRNSRHSDRHSNRIVILRSRIPVPVFLISLTAIILLRLSCCMPFFSLSRPALRVVRHLLQLRCPEPVESNLRELLEGVVGRRERRTF
jgi:hypothetical protein